MLWLPERSFWRFLALALFFAMGASPAGATQILTVEWEGLATSYDEFVDGAWVWVSGASVPVSGTFAVDLDAVPESGGSEDFTWLFEVSDTGLNLTYGNPGDGYWGSCDAWCSLSLDPADILGTLHFSGAGDPEGGNLYLDTGTFGITGHDSYYPSMNGTITGASYTITPEPSAALLVGCGLVGMAARRRRTAVRFH